MKSNFGYFVIFALACFVAAASNDDSGEESGGSSISGVSVTCFNTMENCLEACMLSCYFVDHCNDSPHHMVACAPDLFLMIALTLGFVFCICACCCAICFCSPCCICAVWWKNRRDRRMAERSVTRPYASAPPLLSNNYKV